MKTLLLTLFLLITTNAYADKSVKVNVVRDKFSDNPVTYSASFNLESSEYQLTTVWRSPKGIACDIMLVNPKKLKGAFTCQSLNGYKAQTTFDCSIHVSMQQSAYMYFGQIDNAEETGNFHIWCE